MSLEVFNLTKFYGDKRVVDNVNFKVNEGEIYGILGRNGAGKTTTIKMILGILDCDYGHVNFRGKRLDVLREKVGYLPEEKSLYYKSKVSDHLYYFGRLSGLSSKNIREKINYWTNRFCIEEYLHKPIASLSKGNQQKVQIISTILHNPQILIFDEPFSGLDPVNSQVFRDVIIDLKNKGKYILFCTHQMHYVEEFCTDISIFKKGEQVLSGNLMDIKRSFGRNKLVLEVDGNLPSMNLYGIIGIKKVKDTYEIDIMHERVADDILRLLYNYRLRIFNFSLRYKSLHEIFLEVAGDA